MGEEEEPAVSPTGSSPPPLEDMSKVLRIHAKLSQRDQEGQPIYQVYQVDQRELNVDQRSIHLQHNIFNPDPSVVGRLAASAAASEMRAEATHAVSAVMTEATAAVAAARAQTSEAAVRAEATQAAAQAREAAMEFELRSLRTMVESLRAENNDLRDRARMIESQSPNADSNPNLNGAAIEHRILGIENFIQRDILPRLTHLEGMFTLLGDLDHEVRENMLPRMQGFDESVQQIMDWLETSAVNAPPRANIQQEPNSQPGSPVHHAIWDESDVEDDQERNQEAGQDVEGRSLRHSPLEAPTTDPRASCQLQSLAKCCPMGFACL
jgi:multidrug efflux pump subunit AcrA (membrane-fusion protein)